MGGFPALEFDGANDFMSAGDVEVHGNTDGLTVLAVCRPDASGNRVMVSKYDTSTGERAFGLRADAFYVMDQKGTWDQNRMARFTPDLGRWQILTGMWEPGSACQIFQDGVWKDDAATATVDIDDTVSSLILGAQNEGTTYFYHGGLAEVLIFDRALSWAEHNAVGWYLSQKYGLQTTFAPEPSSSLLLVIGMAIGLMSRRRRRWGALQRPRRPAHRRQPFLKPRL